MAAVAVETARPLALPARLAWISTHRELLAEPAPARGPTAVQGLGPRHRLVVPAAAAHGGGVHAGLQRALARHGHPALSRIRPHRAGGLLVLPVGVSCRGTTSIVDNGSLVKKIWFPREIVVVSSVLSHALAACVMFAIVIPAGIVLRRPRRQDLLDPRSRIRALIRWHAVSRSCSPPPTCISATWRTCRRALPPVVFPHARAVHVQRPAGRGPTRPRHRAPLRQSRDAVRRGHPRRRTRGAIPAVSRAHLRHARRPCVLRAWPGPVPAARR